MLINDREEDYIINFEVVSHKSTGGYPLVLGCRFLRKCGGVVNWMSNTPTFTYGPAKNQTKIEIASKGPLFLDGGLPAIFTPSAICAEAVADLGPITCIDPRLYDYVDDGTFNQWLVDNPYDKNEPHIMFIEVQKPQFIELDYNSFKNEDFFDCNPSFYQEGGKHLRQCSTSRHSNIAGSIQAKAWPGFETLGSSMPPLG